MLRTFTLAFSEAEKLLLSDQQKLTKLKFRPTKDKRLRPNFSDFIGALFDNYLNVLNLLFTIMITSKKGSAITIFLILIFVALIIVGGFFAYKYIFSGEKESIFSGAQDGTLKKIDKSKGEEIWSFKAESSYQYYSPWKIILDEDLIFIAGTDGTLRKVNKNSGNEVDRFSLSGRPQSMALDQNRIYAGVQISENNQVMGGKIIAIEKSTGNEVWSIEEDPYSQPIAISGNYLYSGVEYSDLVKLDKNDGEEIWRFDEHSHPINAIVVDGNYVYTGSSDGTIRKIDAQTGKGVLGFSEVFRSQSIHSMALDENYIYAGVGQNSLVKINKTSMEEVWKFEGHTNRVKAIVVDEDYIYSAGWDNTLRKINKETGKEVWKFEGHTSYIETLEIEVLKDE